MSSNATNTTDTVVDNDDDTLIAGISAYLPMFCVTLVLYAVLHMLFRRYFYTNIRRGTGPSIPSRGSLCGWLFCVPMLRGRDGALLDEPREAPLWRMSDDELVEHVKLDAFALLLFIRVAMVVLGGYALYGATVSLIVTYVSAVVEESGAYEGPPGNLARLSLANLKEFRGGDIFGEAATWDIWLAAIASVVGCWLFTLVALVQLRRGWDRMIMFKRRALSDARDAQALAICVRETDAKALLAKARAAALAAKAKAGRISPTKGSAATPTPAPEDALGWSREDVWRLWADKLYPGLVYDVRMVRETGTLPKLLAQHEKVCKTVETLEASVAKLAAEGKPAPDPAQKRLGCLPGLAKKLDDARAKRDQLVDDVRAAYEKCAAPENDRGVCYFVLFREQKPCNLARQVCHFEKSTIKVLAAPAPKDVNWGPLRPSALKLAMPLRHGATAAYCLMLAFYSLPIFSISQLLELDSLQKALPVLTPVLRALGPDVRAGLRAFLPTLALIVFLALLPVICEKLAGLHGYESRGKIQRHAFSYLFTFQLVWVFFGIVLATSVTGLISDLQRYAESPMEVLTTLGGQLAAAATFFMVWLGVQMFWALPFKELTRAVPVALGVAKEKASAAIKMASKSKRRSDGSDSPSREAPPPELAPPPEESATPPPPPPEPFPFPVVWSKVLLASTFGICYACVQPVSIFFSLFYLVLSYLLYAKNLLWTYTHEFESGGLSWPTASRFLLLLLAIAQLMLVGVHTLKTNTLTAVGVALTLVATYSQHRYLKTVKEPQLLILPLEVSAANDVAVEADDLTASRRMTAQLKSRQSAVAASRRMTDAQIARVAVAQAEGARFHELFDSLYVQPELVDARKLLKIDERDGHRRASMAIGADHVADAHKLGEAPEGASPHAEAIEAIRLEVKKQSALDEGEDDGCIEVEAKLAAHTHASI